MTTTAPGSGDTGTIFVGANVTWSGDGDLSLVADDSLTVNYNMLSTGAGDLTLAAGGTLYVDAKTLSAAGSGDLTLTAGQDVAIRAHPTNTRTVSTETGALRIDAGRDILMEREGLTVGPHNTQIFRLRLGRPHGGPRHRPARRRSRRHLGPRRPAGQLRRRPPQRPHRRLPRRRRRQHLRRAGRGPRRLDRGRGERAHRLRQRRRRPGTRAGLRRRPLTLIAPVQT